MTVYFEDMQVGDKREIAGYTFTREEIIEFGRRFDPQPFHIDEEVQAELGWGRSYISQLLTKQKSLRVEQVLLILKVIGVDSAELFAELYAPPEELYGGSRPAPRRVDPGQADEQQREIQELRGLLHGLVGLLVEKRVISGEELRVAVEAAEREA